MEDEKGFLDKAQEKVVSRKFIVFILATVLLFLGKVDAEQWVWLGGIYIGTQAVIDATLSYMSKKAKTALALKTGSESDSSDA